MVAAPVELHDELKAAGAAISEETQERADAVLTADGSDNAAWVVQAMMLFSGAEAELQAA
jgi:hypothetical protein